jgi:G3E family GTPase
MSDRPLVYLVLGAAASGRRQIIADLIEGGLGEGDRAAVLLADDETADPADAALALSRWSWTDDAITAELPSEATHVFFVTSGHRNPVDQVEAFKRWLDAQDLELARALCIVNCQLAAQHHALLAWYEACIHFADVVLLNRREGVENKSLSDFLTHFQKQFYPCIFEAVKHGRVKNPALLLEPEARRMTHVFDEEQDWVITNSEGDEIDEEDETSESEELHAAPEEDPYFVRRTEGGRRLKEIPDIRKYLNADHA